MLYYICVSVLPQTKNAFTFLHYILYKVKGFGNTLTGRSHACERDIIIIILLFS